jgi:hypothetical protein
MGKARAALEVGVIMVQKGSDSGYATQLRESREADRTETGCRCKTFPKDVLCIPFANRMYKTLLGNALHPHTVSVLSARVIP